MTNGHAVFRIDYGINRCTCLKYTYLFFSYLFNFEMRSVAWIVEIFFQLVIESR